MVPIAWLIVGVMCFIVFVTPFFIRTGLILPLESLLAGIKRVQSGDLGVEVPVQLNDEIGVVTHNFNKMTKVVREKAILEVKHQQKIKELEEARTLQLAMLPDHPPRLPNLDVSFFMQTATEVGGDYYDYVLFEDEKLTMVLGDATGHGMQAGLIVATTKSYFQSLAQIEATPSQILQRISRGLRDMRLQGRYMGLCLFTYQAQQLSYVSAGMPPTILYRSNSSETAFVHPKGLPLGTQQEIAYEPVDLRLSVGDVMLFMSDGLPELFKCRSGNSGP